MIPNPDLQHSAFVLTALVLGAAESFAAVEMAEWEEHLGIGKIRSLKMS
jgi:hypothetical protein